MNPQQSQPEHDPLAIAHRLRWVAAVAVGLIAFGSVFYHIVEGLKWLDAVYFSVITLTTVGYGDITPHTDAGKLFTIFYVLIGVGIIAASLNILVRGEAQRRLERHHEQRRKDKS